MLPHPNRLSPNLRAIHKISINIKDFLTRRSYHRGWYKVSLIRKQVVPEEAEPHPSLETPTHRGGEYLQEDPLPQSHFICRKEHLCATALEERIVVLNRVPYRSASFFRACARWRAALLRTTSRCICLSGGHPTPP